MVTFKCASLDGTREAAQYFAKLARPGQCFALHGDLGYGKTTFSKYFIQALNKDVDDVTSPTFAIVQIYECKDSEIWHVDCYRMVSEDEFYELGLEEAFSKYITIIEWPNIIEHLLPESTIHIEFKMAKDNVRMISWNDENFRNKKED